MAQVPSAVADKEKEIMEKYYSAENTQPPQDQPPADQTPTDTPVPPVVDAPPPSDDQPKPDPEVERLRAELERSQQAYNTLKGKYDAELPELYRNVKMLSEEVANLKSAPAPTKPVEPVPEVVTALADSHPAMVEAITYIAKKAAEEAIRAAVDATVKPLEDRLNATARTVQETAEERFERTLTEQVKGDWRALDKDQRFIDWLNVPDRYTGVTRLELLRRAYASGSAATVANFFNDYLSETGQTTASDSPPRSKERLVTPSHSGKAKAPASTEVEAVTRKELVQFTNDLTSGKYRGREEERQKMQAKIDRAIAANRIID